MMMWYDKLAVSGLAIAFVGWMMFVVGLGCMMSANRKARADFAASIQEARQSLRTAP